MRVIKKGKIEATGRFLVERPFRWEARIVSIGEEVEVKDPTEAMTLVNAGKIKPILPPVSVYIALASFQLPGRARKYEAKKHELVELRACDALPLLLQNVVIPKSDEVWRPFGRKLKN